MSTVRTPAWTRADLDDKQCLVPDCRKSHHHGPLFLSGRCHPKAPQLIRYEPGGTILMSCAACELHTINLAVSPEQQVELDGYAARGCGDPSCTDMHVINMKPPCHPGAGNHAVYNDGVLHMICGKCQSDVDHLHIKEKPADVDV